MTNALFNLNSNCFRSLIAKQWSSDIRLDGKTAIVTGANTGIGKATAKDLAMRGAHVVLACRDMEKAEEAVADIMREVESASVVAMKLDLADTKSICEFAENIYNTEKSLHFLINNAGVALCTYATTVDGFEMQFGVNHLGHFLLTYLLLDLLKHSAPSRVINLASVAHLLGKINFEDVNSAKSYHSTRSYAQSKLANVLFSRELARRVEDLGITVYAVDPGVVHTEIFRHMRRYLQVLVKTCSIFLRTPAEGSYTTLFCAVTPDLESGGYYSDCAPATCSRAASDDRSACKLWALSCQLLNIRWR
ncbi:retinol dehydrogenase 12 [Clupea harengus]|uniref:Retinol dehydrogenase 12 n=1 Tax=Clupea harengus TaxID=7950 RepID=A0A6P8GXS9_CLUHA|nr:retinol dehydrogenase 12 [Clupea harengus]